MDWSIQDVARLAGTTSRTLRHYDAVGLLSPSRIGSNGYRFYDQAALVRLQRILLLRQLGLGLPAIADVLDGTGDDAGALRDHLARLRSEQDRIGRQVVSVQRTITRLEAGVDLMADEMFDGFDHTQYKDEVEQRWGAQAYADSDAWWRGLTDEQRQAFKDESSEIAAAWRAAHEAGLDPACDQVQDLVRRHQQWVSAGWGGQPCPRRGARGMAQMYVDDERFGRNYGGPEGAGYVRDALTIFAERHL